MLVAAVGSVPVAAQRVASEVVPVEVEAAVGDRLVVVAVDSGVDSAGVAVELGPSPGSFLVLVALPTVASPVPAVVRAFAFGIVPGAESALLSVSVVPAASVVPPAFAPVAIVSDIQ